MRKPKSLFFRCLSLPLLTYPALTFANETVMTFEHQYPLCAESQHQRVNLLATALREARQAYYQGKQPLLSDSQYDAYWLELSALTTCDAELDQVGETLNQTFGGPYIKHHHLMRSLKSVRDSFSSLAFFHQNKSKQIIMQPKIDGVAVELVYENGELIAASSRGDGKQGRNLLAIVKACSWIPDYLPETMSAVIQGELYVPENIWRKRGKYVSSRHMAAGITNQKAPSLKDIDSLKFMPWLWVDAPYTEDDESLLYLSSLGFNNMARYTHVIKNEDDLNDWFQHYQSTPPMEMKLDGVVLKLNDLMVREQYGYNQRYPHWALAQKFTGPKATAHVVDVVNQLGPKGRLTPVVYLSPITLANRKIEKVSGHSIPWLKKMAIQKGSQVEIELVGDANPQIIAVRR